MNKEETERVTYEEFMTMFKFAPRMCYTLYDKAEDKITQLTNNWNELEKWVKELQKFKGINQQGFSWGVAQEVLDKMKEIKENK